MSAVEMMFGMLRYDRPAGPGPTQNASSACRTCIESRSASEKIATVATPSSRQARLIRSAISPRFAIKTFRNKLQRPTHARPKTAVDHTPPEIRRQSQPQPIGPNPCCERGCECPALRYSQALDPIRRRRPPSVRAGSRERSRRTARTNPGDDFDFLIRTLDSHANRVAFGEKAREHTYALSSRMTTLRE